MKRAIIFVLVFIVLSPAVVQAQLPQPGIQASQSLEPIDIDNQKLATASGDVGLGLPDAALMRVADVPDMSLICEDRLGWWVPLVAQVALLGLWLWRRRDADEKEAALVLALIMIGTQMFHGAIGCSCTESSWCDRYLIFNLLVSGLAFGVFAYRDKRYQGWQKQLQQYFKKG